MKNPRKTFYIIFLQCADCRVYKMYNVKCEFDRGVGDKTADLIKKEKKENLEFPRRIQFARSIVFRWL